jgi:hypothetical protein
VNSVNDTVSPLLFTMSTSQSLVPLGPSTVAATPTTAAGSRVGPVQAQPTPTAELAQ